MSLIPLVVIARDLGKNLGRIGEHEGEEGGSGRSPEGRIVLSSEFCSFLFLSSTLSSLKYYSLSFKKKRVLLPITSWSLPPGRSIRRSEQPDEWTSETSPSVSLPLPLLPFRL